MAFKDANVAYQAAVTTRKRQAKYEEAHRPRPELDPTPISISRTATTTCIKPAKKGDANNDAYLTKAIENYKKARSEQSPIRS